MALGCALQDERGEPLNVMSLSRDYPGLLGISDVTDQSGRLIADGHQCVFRVTCTEKQLDALQADARYTIFPVDGEPTLTEKLELQKHDERIGSLPAGVKREQIKDILVEKFRLQGLERLIHMDAGYNISPTQSVAVIREMVDRRETSPMHWRL